MCAMHFLKVFLVDELQKSVKGIKSEKTWLRSGANPRGGCLKADVEGGVRGALDTVSPDWNRKPEESKGREEGSDLLRNGTIKKQEDLSDVMGKAYVSL